MTELSPALLDGVLARVGRPDYQAFEAQLRSSGYCARPVQLRGRVEVCQRDGTRRQVWSTDGEPDQLLRKACGNRREAICPPCAERYRGDAWQLIAAGLKGGKGIPETVAGHPAVFATLTAPSFGPVHAHRVDADGHPAPCRPRRDAPVCPHGRPMGCSQRHGPEDPCLGEPLCPACFDYDTAVLWNNAAGELWRRLTIYLERRLAALTNMTQKRLRELVRVSYVKVGEYQQRGLLHFHPLIRLDRRMPAYRADELHAPDRRFTSDLLEQALREAAATVGVTLPEQLGGGVLRFGAKLDVQQLTGDPEERSRRAGYLAKYSTKSTEQAGGLLQRVARDDVDRVPVRDHVRRFLHAAFDLADTEEGRERRMDRCAHTFGSRGHCLTKSRRWSTTFKALRQARERHVHEQQLARSPDATQRALAALAPEHRISSFQLVGVGHLTTADAYLAAQAAARARESRELAREALYDHHNPGGEDRCDTPQDRSRAA